MSKDAVISQAPPVIGRSHERKTITVAVAGNPNSGKSTLINAVAGTRLHVGNWPGVTVEKKEATLNFQDRRIRLVDLPGTYSLSPYTQEEIIARDYLVHEKADVIIVMGANPTDAKVCVPADSPSVVFRPKPVGE